MERKTLKIVHGVHERITNKMDDFVLTGAAIYGQKPRCP